MSCEEKKQKEEKEEQGCGCTSAGGSEGSEDSQKTSEQVGTCCPPEFPDCAEMMKKMAALKQGKQQTEE